MSPFQNPLSGVGLSPRVRGSPDRLHPREATDGSIPACAGEPSFCIVVTLNFAVYPRVCGGANSM